MAGTWVRDGVRVVASLLWVGAFMACSGRSDDSDGSGVSETTAASYEGIYELTARTENESACDSPGADLLASSDPNFIMLSYSVLGTRQVQLTSCDGLDDCRAKVDALRTMQAVVFQYGASFGEEVDSNELTGFSSSTGYKDGDLCVERAYEEHVLTRDGDTVRLETFTKGLPDEPAEDDTCWSRPVEDEKEARNAPCVATAMLEGLRVADL